MYQSPPSFPYPAGYGYPNHPPPGGFRTSQTPHPFGTSSKHTRRSSQQVPSSFYSARGVPPPQGFVDPRYAAYYSSPLRNAADNVSPGFYHDTSPKGQPRYTRAPENLRSSGKTSRDHTRYRASSWRQAYSPDDILSDEEELLYDEYVKRVAADLYRYYYQGREYTPRKEEPKTPKANQSRPRRASHATDVRPDLRPEARPQTTAPKAQYRKKERPERQEKPEKPEKTRKERKTAGYRGR